MDEAWLLWVVYAAIAITALEVLWLLRTRRRWAMAANVVAGLCLMLALQNALIHGPAWVVLWWLSLSGLAHVAYLRTALGAEPGRH